MSEAHKNADVLSLLGEIYQAEAAGVNRYLHYSFMIMGYNRIPIQKWFRDNATESMDHAIVIGEKMTSLGGHPPVITAHVEESNLHGVQQLLAESLKAEETALALYKDLAKLAEQVGDIALEELARTAVQTETEHVDEIKKMMTKPEA